MKKAIGRHRLAHVWVTGPGEWRLAQMFPLRCWIGNSKNMELGNVIKFVGLSGLFIEPSEKMT
jgi:hypothetical protein